MSQYSDMVTAYLNDMLTQGRQERCPGISQTVTEAVCNQARDQLDSVTPSFTPFRDTLLQTAYDTCSDEVQPYVQCQCLNSNISLSNGCNL